MTTLKEIFPETFKVSKDLVESSQKETILRAPKLKLPKPLYSVFSQEMAEKFKGVQITIEDNPQDKFYQVNFSDNVPALLVKKELSKTHAAIENEKAKEKNKTVEGNNTPRFAFFSKITQFVETVTSKNRPEERQPLLSRGNQ